MFDDDRRYAEAYAKGGIEEERKEREVVKQEEKTKAERNRKAFHAMIEKAREEKRLADEAKAKEEAANKEN